MNQTKIESFFSPFFGGILFVALIASNPALFSQDFPEPTRHHKLLEQEVGVWDVTTKFWLSPESEPQVSTGTETCEMLGGFWLIAKFEGDLAGMPFVGVGQTGYDPETQQYISTWIDSMASPLVVSKGQYDAAKKTLTLKAVCKDWMTGEPKQMKMITQYHSEETKHFEIHEASIGSDKWSKTMESDSIRRK